MKFIAILISCAYLSASTMAHATTNYEKVDTLQLQENDSVKTEQLKEVVVEARYSQLSAQRSTYIPTLTQKNSAINATDLINRMGIPQLQTTLGETLTTLTGQPVNIFIDYMPASKEELAGMKTTDVKRVEYYDYPSDARFQGKAHVVNFIMQQYEYGGYVKPYLERCMGARTAQWALFNRVQYKRMTFDFALDGVYKNQNRLGSDMIETYSLPLKDDVGPIENNPVRIIEKHSIIHSGELLQRNHYAYFKTKYNSEKLNMQHNLWLNLTRRPRYQQSGSVSYSEIGHNDFNNNDLYHNEFYHNEFNHNKFNRTESFLSVPLYEVTNYESSSSNRASSLKYSGYIYYQFDSANSLGFDPQFVYSHTNTSSLYYEDPSQKFYNGARDTTHEYMIPIDYDHNFKDWGKLHVHFLNYFSWSNTEYFGTAQSKDHSEQLDFTAGARYTLSKGNFYGFIGAGYYWDKTQYGAIRVKSHSPWADFSLQYSPNDKQSAIIEYHHMSSSPSPNYFSDNIIQKDALMSYTGNPRLRPYHCHDLSVSYNFVPNNKYSLSAYGYMYQVTNRYIEEYAASPNGILRKVSQDCGNYRSFDYGIRSSARYLQNKLQITGGVYGSTWYNEAPYNQKQTKFFYYVQANYYIGNWNFGAMYYSRRTYPDGFSNSQIITTRATYFLSAGWSNSIWNIRCTIYNLAKWNYASSITTMNSPSYSYVSNTFSQADHFYVKLTGTYIFSFGKKVQRGNDTIQKSSVSSAILK